MPGLFQVKELEARKRALAAESEVYRQSLRFELHNLDLNAVHARRRFFKATAFSPLIMLGMPAIGFFVRRMFTRQSPIENKQRSSLARFITKAAFGWRMYWKVAPFCRGVVRSLRKFREAPDVGGPKLVRS